MNYPWGSWGSWGPWGWCNSSRISTNRSNQKFVNNDNAKEILKNRLAKGEISEIEYDNLLKKILL